MHPFEQTVSVVGPIVGAIMVVTLFFKIVGWFSRRSTANTVRVAFKKVLDDETRVTVQLIDGRSFEDVRFVGLIDLESLQGPFPVGLQGMAVLARPDGGRVLVRARTIRMIEVPPGEA